MSTMGFVCFAAYMMGVLLGMLYGTIIGINIGKQS